MYIEGTLLPIVGQTDFSLCLEIKREDQMTKVRYQGKQSLKEIIRMEGKTVGVYCEDDYVTKNIELIEK